LNSINVINAGSQHKNDDELKNALISVAKYDNNPGVRREAIKSFNELSVDKEIKDALIYVLLNDTSAGIRIEAINSLMETSKKGIKLDESDLTTLKDKIQLDQNNYVRYQLRNIIKEY
ncbi:MAG: HEAT repeat domain-containing protein, partial [Ignavibacteriaceae bacterium]